MRHLANRQHSTTLLWLLLVAALASAATWGGIAWWQRAQRGLFVGPISPTGDKFVCWQFRITTTGAYHREAATIRDTTNGRVICGLSEFDLDIQDGQIDWSSDGKRLLAIDRAHKSVVEFTATPTPRVVRRLPLQKGDRLARYDAKNRIVRFQVDITQRTFRLVREESQLIAAGKYGRLENLRWWPVVLKDQLELRFYPPDPAALAKQQQADAKKATERALAGHAPNSEGLQQPGLLGMTDGKLPRVLRFDLEQGAVTRDVRGFVTSDSRGYLIEHKPKGTRVLSATDPNETLLRIQKELPLAPFSVSPSQIVAPTTLSAGLKIEKLFVFDLATKAAQQHLVPKSNSCVGAGDGQVWLTTDAPSRILQVDAATGKVTTILDLGEGIGLARAAAISCLAAIWLSPWWLARRYRSPWPMLEMIGLCLLSTLILTVWAVLGVTVFDPNHPTAWLGAVGLGTATTLALIGSTTLRSVWASKLPLGLLMATGVILLLTYWSEHDVRIWEAMLGGALQIVITLSGLRIIHARWGRLQTPQQSSPDTKAPAVNGQAWQDAAPNNQFSLGQALVLLTCFAALMAVGRGLAWQEALDLLRQTTYLNWMLTYILLISSTTCWAFVTAFLPSRWKGLGLFVLGAALLAAIHFGCTYAWQPRLLWDFWPRQFLPAMIGLITWQACVYCRKHGYTLVRINNG